MNSEQNIIMMKSQSFLLLMLCCGATGIAADPAPRAARSVHLWWSTPDATHFYNEMTVEESTRGSYFMACGFNQGYFGIQELGNGEKVIIFSIWDPTKGDDPKAVAPEERVEVLHSDKDARIKRFGGEGTGGQCMMPFPWKIGETHRFLVTATVEGEKTAYAGYVFIVEQKQWKHLVTFRTRTKGDSLKGLYSFVEDFRRDGKSVNETRRARFGNGWVRTAKGDWAALTHATFTASNSTWEAKDNINAGMVGNSFLLATGGDIRNATPLNTKLERQPIGQPPKNIPQK